MFTQQLPEAIFVAQREFIKKMSPSRDFTWWAKTLVTEETKELQEAHEEQPLDMNHIFKEFADLVYVVAGFYNTMPNDPHSMLTEAQNKELQDIFDEAAETATLVSQTYRIPPHLIEMAFNIVHDSNMSKINPETGEPDRREDGKILKGPNYIVPDMSPVVEAWQVFVKQAMEAETVEQANKGNPDAATSD